MWKIYFPHKAVTFTLNKLSGDTVNEKVQCEAIKKDFNLWFSKSGKALENLTIVTSLTNFGKIFGILSE